VVDDAADAVKDTVKGAGRAVEDVTDGAARTARS
jgi:hypothetical protein